MLTQQTDPATGVIEITVDGAISKDEYHAAVTAIQAAIDAHGKVRVIEVVKSLGWVDPAVWWQDVRWVFTHLNGIGRCAVVTDKGWVGSITRAVSALMPTEIRVFALGELDEARRWVRE
jgi:hypothetical protein